MKRIALATALVASMAAPAFADGHSTSVAIMHFNMDAESQSDVRMTPMGLTTIDLGMDASLSDVFGHLNMDVESLSDLRGEGGVTIIMSDPGQAAEIFRRLMAESREDE